MIVSFVIKVFSKQNHRARREKFKQEQFQPRNLIATIEKNGARCQEKVAAPSF